MVNLLQSEQVAITGGTFTQNVLAVDHNKISLEILYSHVASGAFHDSAERVHSPKCHPGTRTAIQNDIVDLVKATLRACIIWLYGATGAGKTAIAQTIAEKCDSLDKSQALLLGSFFFLQTSSSRNNSTRLGASLAYQLARAIPSTLPHIFEHMKDNPAIFQSNLESQLINLFIEPLRRASRDHPELCSQPRLVILDGLNECDPADSQQHTIVVLNKILAHCPVPIVFLITSRPEVHITASFDSLEAAEIDVSRISLNDRYEATSDMHVYLQSSFSAIKRKPRFRHLLSADWPARGDVEKIVDKSSGQFIFASTIVRYIDSDLHDPSKRLRDALELTERYEAKVKASNIHQIERLYTQTISEVEERVLSLAILRLRAQNESDILVLESNPENSLGVIQRLRPSDSENLALAALQSIDRLESQKGQERFAPTNSAWPPEREPEPPATSSLYRAFSPGGGNHFYTTDADEYRNATAYLAYIAEGIACRLFTDSVDGRVPFYRLFKPGETDHLYTTSATELSNAISMHGYTYEGIVGYVCTTTKTGTIPLYRVWHGGSVDHFYTTDAEERNRAVQMLGFVDEDVAAYVLPAIV